MRAKKILFTLFLVSLVALVHAVETGTIRGTIIDDDTGETLPGVTVYIEETQNGTISDLDGQFNLSLEPGLYDLRISFVSYETLIINDLEVVSGEVIVLDDLRLKVSSTEIAEIVISAERVKNTESALLTIKQISNQGRRRQPISSRCADRGALYCVAGILGEKGLANPLVKIGGCFLLTSKLV